MSCSHQSVSAIVRRTDPPRSPPESVNGAKPPSSEENCGVGLQFITRNNGDVEVVRVRQGGPADFAGVLVGDKVTAVNGVSTHDPLSTGIDVARLILGPEGSV